MPRICDSSNEPIDFCMPHFPAEADARELYGNGERRDVPGDCFTYDAPHPPYSDTEYKCAECGFPLLDMDNGPAS